MSMPTLAPHASDDGFNDLEFALIVADFKPDPDPEPEPDEPTTPTSVRRGRPSRAIADRDAIHQSLGIRRHRTSEREV